MSVVALEYLTGIPMAQGRGSGACRIEEEIHAYRKVRGVDESGSVLLDHAPDALPFPVPARRSHDHVLARFGASFDVGDHAVGGGEVDDGINLAKLKGRERGTRGVFFRSRNLDVMFALGGHFGDQRAGLATT